MIRDTLKHTRNREKNTITNDGSKEKLIDKGKMRALFRAGWTVGMIALEMNLPEKEVDEALSYYDENGNWKGEE